MINTAPQHHWFSNFEIQKYYQSGPRFNGDYSRNNIPKIKDGTYVIIFSDYKSIVTHWIALYVNDDNAFDGFGFEHFLKETKKYIGYKIITRNIEYKHRFNNMWILLSWIY